jgi:hypothetical protein
MGPPAYDTAAMLRADLKAANVKEEANGFVDFHALRHTFITHLAQSGVHPKVAQDLARRSDINLTMSRYSHTVLEQRAGRSQCFQRCEKAGGRRPDGHGFRQDRRTQWICQLLAVDSGQVCLGVLLGVFWWKTANLGELGQPHLPMKHHSPEWRNGRRSGFKIHRLHGREGSTPSSGTNTFYR